MFALGSCNSYISLKKKYRDIYVNFGYEWSLKEFGSLWVLDQINQTGAKRVAEFGPGFNTFFSAQMHKIGVEYWCIDRSDSNAGIGSNRDRYLKTVETRSSRNQRTVEAFLGDNSHELPSGYFDIVFSISVVEHIDAEPMEACVKDAMRILTPSGQLTNSIDTYFGSRKHQEWHNACLNGGLAVSQPHHTDWSFNGNRTTFLERQDIRYQLYNGLTKDNMWQKDVPYVTQFATVLHAAGKA